MQDESRRGIGIDIGTDTVRVTIASARQKEQPTIIGYAEAKNTGMRKGTIINIDRTAEAIDKALGAAEKMSGYRTDSATVSINGSHIGGLTSKGVIAVTGREVSQNDVHRAQDAARVVQLGENREILDITPRNYALGDQDNIKDPVGMVGVRLEVDTFIVTSLAPHIRSLEKVLEMTDLPKCNIVLSGIAAAKATLTEQQRENGVICVDLGGSTTNIAVYEEGELLHTAVLPIGSNNITNDLAIGLRTDLDIAERVKLQYAVATPAARKVNGHIKIKTGDTTHLFDTEVVDEIAAARVEEIFELINLELKQINRYAKLPGGVVITGGGAQLTGISEAVKDVMRLSARVGKPPKFNGMGDKLVNPAWSTALGLMMIDLDDNLMLYNKNQSKPSGFWPFGHKKKA